ncbi:hypothetical protein RQP46_005615 [Phenoliferia psychrophenolica]
MPFPVSTAVLEFLAGLTNGHAAEVIDKYYAPKGTYTNMPGGMATFTGPEEVKAAINGFFSLMEMDTFTTFHIASNSTGYVFTERVDRFRTATAFHDLLLMGIFKVKDGMIQEWRDYFDIGDVEKALGLHFR